MNKLQALQKKVSSATLLLEKEMKVVRGGSGSDGRCVHWCTDFNGSRTMPISGSGLHCQSAFHECTHRGMLTECDNSPGCNG